MKNLKRSTFALSILIALLCAGCGDKVVSSTHEKTGQIEGTNSCDAGPGYCMECGLNVAGGFDCMPKFKYSCTGTQKAIFDVYKVKRVHESGKVSYVKNNKFVEAISECT